MIVRELRKGRALEYQQIFGDYAEFAQWVLSAPRAQGARESSEKESKDWNGNVSLEGAVALARDGWPAGRELLKGAISGLQRHAAPEKSQARRFSVAGGAVHVPRFVAGVPAHMVGRGRAEWAAAPVVSLLVSCAYSSAATQNAIRNRGAAICDAIDTLETEGFSVELTLCAPNDHDDALKTDCRVPLKLSSEALNIDRVAFALAHPAMFRRIMFKHMETVPYWQESGPRMCRLYGINCDPTIDEPGAVAFPGILGSGAAFETPEKARKTVTAMIAAGLESVDVHTFSEFTREDVKRHKS